MNSKYDFYMTRNMHQLFLQVTREGAHDTVRVLDNMLLDVDQLVEGVYQDRMNRSAFHTALSEPNAGRSCSILERASPLFRLAEPIRLSAVS